MTTYKKKHKIKKIKTVNNKANGELNFGVFGLKTLEACVLSEKQVETVRRVIAQCTRRVSKVKIRVFFQHPITKKSLQSRMGKGSGAIKGFIANVKSGTIILEISNVKQNLAIKALQSGRLRLPIKTKIISKDFF